MTRNRTIARRLAAAAALPALVAAVPAGAATVEDLAAVQQRYEDAANAGDLDALVGLFAPTGALLPIVGGIFEGPDAIRAALQENRPGTLDIVTTNASMTGDTLIGIGTFTFAPADGSPLLMGEYVSIVRDTGAGLEIVRLILFPPRMPTPTP